MILKFCVSFSLRVCLVNEAPVIRMGALRVLRYLTVTEEDLIVLNATQLPYLIVRSLDIKLNNIGERTQAIRLCQRFLAIPNGAAHFPSSITRSLVALGFDGEIDQDKIHVSSLSLLCQLALLNPMLFIECGGVRVLLHNILGFTSPMVLEAMIGSLLHLLNVPETRDASGVNLQSLVAPFTDVHFKLNASEKPNIGQTMLVAFLGNMLNFLNNYLIAMCMTIDNAGTNEKLDINVPKLQ